MTPARCPSCQTELPPDAPAGVCPKCLVQAGFASGQAPTSASANPPLAATSASPSAGVFVPPSPADLAKLFPQLEILELLGRGGMGAVYKARQPSLDRIVALKILPLEAGRDPAFADRFAREARALARLSHPHIVALFESGQVEGMYFFLMEFVDGVNLRQAMQGGGLTTAQALAIIPQLCDALQYAHEEGVVHRDVKPENILLDKRGRVKIADFGLSKLLGSEVPEPELTATHQVMGTLRYMAPEQMEGTRAVDHRADIYSLGVVFYELLTGEVPMGRFEPPSHRVQVDVRLDEVVLRSLAREPLKRYQHASEVKSDVEAIAKDKVAMLAQKTAPDGIAFQRLTFFNAALWFFWTLLLAVLHWGYLTDASWYFKKELPYDYVSSGWTYVSIPFLFLFNYWLYLLVKSPETPRSFQDAFRLLQTPDRRFMRLWIPALAYLAAFVVATVVTMSFFNDDVQSTTLTALIVFAPPIAFASCAWAFRERAARLWQEKYIPPPLPVDQPARP